MAFLPSDRRARIAIDLGAESCRVSLLRWTGEHPSIAVVHRIPNGPVHARDGTLRWPLEEIFPGLLDGLRRAAEIAPEGVASIAVDGWAVDYVRVDSSGQPLADPFCYRDERTIAAKAVADSVVPPEWMYAHTGAQPLRINTVYQLLADRANGGPWPGAWVNLPEYVLFRLGGRRVAEFTNATHTGLLSLATGGYSEELLKLFAIPTDSLPTLVPTGTVIGRLSGELSRLPPFRDTALMVPASHDTASAIAGIATELHETAYICSGTWSLVGTLVDQPITTPEALSAGFTNQGAAGGGFCFHTNVNGMWMLKQCMDTWKASGRAWEIGELIARAAECDCPGTVPVDAAPLLLDGNMPARLNDELRKLGCATIDSTAGNEPRFARLIFESLAARYASVVRNLESLIGRPIRRIHVLGGGSQNRLLTDLTARYTGLPVELGNVESSTIGNFAVQLAAADSPRERLERSAVQRWALRLSSAGAQAL